MTETKTEQTTCDTICNICGHVANYPYRSYNQDGKIVAGCIDSVHTDFLSTAKDIAWHYRTNAVNWRNENKPWRKSDNE